MAANFGPIAFESVSNVTSTNSTELGMRRWFAGEEYVYCYNATGSAATQGCLMVSSGLSGYSFTRSSTASADFPMVAVKHATVSAGQYFWGLVRGELNAMSIAMTKGLLLTVGDDGAIATALVGSFPTGPVIGKALSTSTGNAQPSVMVKLFG